MNTHRRFWGLTIASVVVAIFCTGLAIDGIAADDEKNQTAETKPADRNASQNEEKPYVPKTKRELQRSLTKLQFDVTQNEATEPAFKNVYWNNKRKGVYKCIVCDRDLFSSQTKYKSGTGWPSFYAPVSGENVGTRTDYRLFYARKEVHCSRCNAHLGHVFDDGPKPTGLRYCMNSASLRFVEDDATQKTSKQSEKSDQQK